MAKVTCTISCDWSQWRALLAKAQPQIDAMPEDKAERMADEWATLRAHGAQEADCGMGYGLMIHVYLSHDLKQHLRRFGVVV